MGSVMPAPPLLDDEQDQQGYAVLCERNDDCVEHSVAARRGVNPLGNRDIHGISWRHFLAEEDSGGNSLLRGTPRVIAVLSVLAPVEFGKFSPPFGEHQKSRALL